MKPAATFGASKVPVPAHSCPPAHCNSNRSGSRASFSHSRTPGPSFLFACFQLSAHSHPKNSQNKSLPSQTTPAPSIPAIPAIYFGGNPAGRMPANFPLKTLPPPHRTAPPVSTLCFCRLREDLPAKSPHGLPSGSGKALAHKPPTLPQTLRATFCNNSKPPQPAIIPERNAARPTLMAYVGGSSLFR